MNAFRTRRLLSGLEGTTFLYSTFHIARRTKQSVLPLQTSHYGRGSHPLATAQQQKLIHSLHPFTGGAQRAKIKSLAIRNAVTCVDRKWSCVPMHAAGLIKAGVAAGWKTSGTCHRSRGRFQRKPDRRTKLMVRTHEGRRFALYSLFMLAAGWTWRKRRSQPAALLHPSVVCCCWVLDDVSHTNAPARTAIGPGAALLLPPTGLSHRRLY